MKLAYFSPLGPQRSGISDYSEELLPYLARRAEITLFVDGFQPSNKELTSRFDVYDYRRKRSLLRELDRFDAVVYHMGNDHRYHSGIFDAMMQRPGIVVLHDFGLQDFFLGLARERNDPSLYLNEVEFCHGKKIRDEAAEELTRGAIPSIVSRPLDVPLNKRIVNSAEGIIVHSNWVRERLVPFAAGVPIVHIPHLVNVEEKRPPRADREVRIASFGLITPGKGIELALRALSKLRKTHRFRYALVGEPNSFYDVLQLIRTYGLDDEVEITGHVSLDQFKQRIRETDIAINLRERTVGETSGCLCRLMATGVCSVVADVGWYSELPNDSVVKMTLDSTTDQLLLAYLERLIDDEQLRTRIGENARHYAHAKHAVTRVADSYLNFIEQVINGRFHSQILSGISDDLVQLGTKATDEIFLQSVAREVSLLMPPTNNPTVSTNGNHSSSHFAVAEGRTPKVTGIDYKEAARNYLANIPEERRHHLRTKPFYNLANKPEKYRNEGMDEDMHRHFCDFANMAVTLALPPDSRILDVGCGSGWLSEYFARLGYIVKGIDISPDLIQMSRERVSGVPYGADHETPLRCSFEVHDIELAPLSEKFDAIICYDSLHHFEDERSVVSNLAKMLDLGGSLFILEGDRPPAGSPSENELLDVMNRYGTLESPFKYEHLRRILDENGFAVIGDYASINGLFDRASIVDDVLPLKNIAIDQNYLACKKVIDGAAASTVPDSKEPGLLRAEIRLVNPLPTRITAGESFQTVLEIQNQGDTLWIVGREPQLGIVMPGVKLLDEAGKLLREVHGEPPLPRSVAPTESLTLKISHVAPLVVGRYTLKIDLVDQQVCWFEHVGSTPLLIEFEVTAG
ncbi:MAG TPA: methyltransferase domain-containing protein [Pyrinomonadaceae bacterium]|jgi:2-polyprenyl-3-methyl-5-hydroxy-6-metoxy-1,4-benzoquinol methylase|nr:methyltransferase domain-containing protein [Pyrinomonadaceae bacterium]